MPIARRQKTVIALAAMGVATGAAAVLLWPYLKRLMLKPTITVGQPTITSAAMAALEALER